MVGNSDWRSLVPGADYNIQVQFGNLSPWTFPAKATTLGKGAVVLAGWFSDPNMLAEFGTQSSARFTYQGRPVVALGLQGSGAAVSAMVNCQDIMNAAADPFRTQPKPSTPSRDPFRPAVGR
jgi:hypothetical protein